MTNAQQNLDSARLISRKDAAVLVGLSERTIDRKTRAGEFPQRFIIGRSIFFRFAEVLAWIEERRVIA